MSQCKGFHAHALSNVTASHQIPIRSDSAIPRGNRSLRHTCPSPGKAPNRTPAVAKGCSMLSLRKICDGIILQTGTRVAARNQLRSRGGQ